MVISQLLAMAVAPECHLFHEWNKRTHLDKETPNPANACGQITLQILWTFVFASFSGRHLGVYSLKRLCTEYWLYTTIITTWTEHLATCFICIISFNFSHQPYKEGSNIVLVFRWQNKDSEG